MKPAEARPVSRFHACLVKGPRTREQALRRARYHLWVAVMIERQENPRW